MSYSLRKKRCTYNMDINKCNQQKCNLNNCGIKVDDISVFDYYGDVILRFFNKSLIILKLTPSQNPPNIPGNILTLVHSSLYKKSSTHPIELKFCSFFMTHLSVRNSIYFREISDVA